MAVRIIDSHRPHGSSPSDGGELSIGNWFNGHFLRLDIQIVWGKVANEMQDHVLLHKNYAL